MPQVALITGAAHRVGAAIVRTLHHAGMNIALHYRSSEDEAYSLRDELEITRPNSVETFHADLLDFDGFPALLERTIAKWGRLDCLVNNASTFYPTPFGQTTAAQWDDLLGTNLRAPFFLAQAATPWLRATEGCIVNIVDIYAERPLKDYPVYSVAKAGLVMLTKSLAQELGPQIRVNAIAPGTVLWPEHPVNDAYKSNLLARTVLGRLGSPNEIARAVLFLAQEASYTTGHILTVDGGRSVIP